jgi:hypothetical protein
MAPFVFPRLVQAFAAAWKKTLAKSKTLLRQAFAAARQLSALWVVCYSPRMQVLGPSKQDLIRAIR